jgi:hypothetical protein
MGSRSRNFCRDGGSLSHKLEMMPTDTIPISRGCLRAIPMEDNGHVEPAVRVRRLTLLKATPRLAVGKSLRDIVRLNLPLIV